MTIVATPINSFIAGCFAGVAILVSKSFDPSVFPEYFLIGLLISIVLAAFFLFVVRDQDYKLKAWYSFNELTAPRLMRGFAWIGGASLILLTSEILHTAT